MDARVAESPKASRIRSTITRPAPSISPAFASARARAVGCSAESEAGILRNFAGGARPFYTIGGLHTANGGGGMAENPSFSLEGRRALITGASRGIGQALAAGLGRAGADVALAARDLKGVEAAAEAIRAERHNATALTIDVRDAAAARQAVEQAGQALGGLDILINNAGVEDVRDSLEVDEALWDKIVDT